MEGKEGFKNRVDAILGALEPGSAEKSNAWTPSAHQVSEAGKDACYSSDEEREAEQREAKNPSTLFFQGIENSNGQRIMPSNAFCRAVDAEPEMDLNDYVAEGLTYGKKEKLPSRHMEVLDDNVFEKASDVMQSRQSIAADLMEIDDPADVVKPQGAGLALERQVTLTAVDEQGASKPAPDGAKPSSKKSKPKRVSFSSDVLDAGKGIPQEDSRSTSQPGSGLADLPSSSAPSRPTSYVPDHVRNPGKYTAYVLEEPILVGGGDDGSKNENQSDLLRIVHNAASVRHPEQQESEQEDVTMADTGARIEFNPSHRKPQKMSINPSADRANRGQSVLSNLNGVDQDLENLDTGLEEPLSAQEDEDHKVNKAKTDFAPRTKRNRNLRSKT